MRKHYHLTAHLTREQLHAELEACADATLARRLRVLLLVDQDWAPREIAAREGLHWDTVGVWVRTYNQGGLAALTPHPGRTCGGVPVLDAAQQAALAEALASPGPRGGRWRGQDVADWIEAHTGRQVNRRRGSDYLKRLGYQPPAAGVVEAAAEVVKRGHRGGPRPDRSGLSYAGQTREPYPSDLSDEEWALLAPLVPVNERGPVARVDRREVLNAIYYLERTGCAWRQLPREFPRWQTVYGLYRQWVASGAWAALHDTMRERMRVAEGRAASPSAAALDSQSVKTGEKGGSAATMATKR